MPQCRKQHFRCIRESKNGFDILKSSQIYFKWSSLSLSWLKGNKVITALKRNLWRLCFYTCLSVILFSGEGGGVCIRILRDTVHERTVRILLECILVFRKYRGTLLHIHCLFRLIIKTDHSGGDIHFQMTPFKQTVWNDKLVHNLSLNVHMAWVYKNP